MMSHTAAAEIAKFNALADRWWQADGPMAPLHWMNPARLAFITKALAGRGPAKNMRGLDLGCGAGLLTEPLARLGYRMTALDGAADAVRVAQQRAQAEGLMINYQVGEVPAHKLPQGSFDFVTALEIIEHVDDAPAFLRAALAPLKVGGLLFLSTLNRTLKSRLLAIVGAEYVLRLLPLGTHDYDKFIKPSELVQILAEAGATTAQISGLHFNPLRRQFSLRDDDLAVNYILVAQKRA